MLSHKPKAPLSSFLLFFKDQKHIIEQTYPGHHISQLTTIAGRLWKELTF